MWEGMGRYSVEEWAARGYPWRGNLDEFCALPYSDRLRATLLNIVKRERPKRRHGLPVVERNSPAYYRDVLALNLLIRHPDERALPDLLRFLEIKSPTLRSLVPIRPLDEDRLYKEIILNADNELSLYAAQAIIRLGPKVSREVCCHLERRLAANPSLRYGGRKWLVGDVHPAISDTDLCMLILGFLADAKIKARFDALERRLEASPLEVWRVAKKWFDEGGRTLPRPEVGPRRESEARRIQFPAKRSVGAVLARSPDTVLPWEKIGEARGEVKVLAAREVMLEVSPEAAGDLSFLATLTPYGLHGLNLNGMPVSDESLAWVGRMTSLRHLNLNSTPLTDAGLPHLAGLTSLTTLVVSDTRLTDQSAPFFKRLPGLKSLDVSLTQITSLAANGLTLEMPTCQILYMPLVLTLPTRPYLDLQGKATTDAILAEQVKGKHGLMAINLRRAQVTDEGLRAIAGLSSLSSLDLSGTRITDAGLEHLRGLTSLDTLTLGDTQINGAGFVHLTGMKSLQVLGLHGTKVTDQHMVHVGRLISLRFLDLTLTEVGDEAAACVARLPRLERLLLPHTRITDMGLIHLRGTAALQHLDLSRTAVTDAAVADLKKSLPKCRIQK